MTSAEGYVLLTVRLQNEDDVWTAKCLELGTSTLGDTLEEAEDAISEAVEWHLDASGKHGERGRFFSEHGITIYPTLPEEKPSARRVPVPPQSVVRRTFRPLVPA